MVNNDKHIDFTRALTSVGALGGIAYGISKSKSFWVMAGYSVIFALTGYAVGKGIQSLN